MRTSWNVQRIAKRIVNVLHEEEVPINMIQAVFHTVESDIREYTVPYKPNLEREDITEHDIERQAEAYHRAIERFAKRNDTLDSIYKEFTMLKQESEQKKPDGIIKRFRRFIGS